MATESEENKITEADLDLSLEVGADTEGNLVCKFNLFVMPGMPRSWCVVDVKRWKMMATCCGDLNSCAMACHQSLVDYAKSRPFVYVTIHGDPPEIDSPPFTNMFHTGFVADCDPGPLCELCKMPGVCAIEIRKQRSPPAGYRVRIFHDGSLPSDPSQYIDPSVLYDMAQSNNKGKGKGKKSKKSKEEDTNMAAMAAAHKNEEYLREQTSKVATKLGENSDSEVISRAVRYAGMRTIDKVLEDTLQVEETGGMTTADGSRRRQPGGVFLQLLQQQLSPDQYMMVFQRMPSPAIIGRTAPGGSQSPPASEEADSTLTAAASAPNAIPIGGRSLSGDVQLSTSLGSSPSRSLLSASAEAFNVNAAVFVPKSRSVPVEDLTIEPSSCSESAEAAQPAMDDELMFEGDM